MDHATIALDANPAAPAGSSTVELPPLGSALHVTGCRRRRRIVELRRLARLGVLIVEAAAAIVGIRVNDAMAASKTRGGRVVDGMGLSYPWSLVFLALHIIV